MSHRPKPTGRHPEAPFHFVDDVAVAVGRARELAGEHNVAVTTGDVGGQAFALGPVDEVAMDVVPVVFSTGKRYFGSVDAQHLLEDPHTVIQGRPCPPPALAQGGVAGADLGPVFCDIGSALCRRLASTRAS